MNLDEAILHCEEVMMENLKKTENRNCDDPVAHNCFECAEEHRQLAEWLKELKQSREQTRWIPVSERLPDKEGSYLVTAQPTYNYAKDIRIVHWGGRWVGYNQSEIIAWMPLPEPYKGESEE